MHFNFIENIMTKKMTIGLVFGCLILTGCGGGGSSDSGMLIAGTLTEAGGVTHSKAARHGAGERIEEVEICALGECSTTDSEGQWGIVAPEEFDGGNVLFSVVGHGIDTTLVVDIPEGASEVSLDLQHLEDGTIEAEHITADGETSHHEAESHEHE